ncbi:MAG: hypothetical protein AAFX87_10350 [Bacteroidota bacterium]
MRNTLLIILIIGLLQACKMADVRPDQLKSGRINASDQQKGQALLEESIKAMGYDKFATVETYETTAQFYWRFPWNTMPMHSFPGARNKPLRFRFQVGSFDGQAEYLAGRKEGYTFGLQSWETYCEKPSTEAEQTKDARRSWGLATFHYILETPYRLLNADIITYAGSKEFEGQMYDLVFVSWDKPEPHKEHDQWLLYINQETKFVDLSHLTIRDFFVPFPKSMAVGTVRFNNRVKTDPGMMLPSDIVIQLLAPKKEKRHVYRLTFKDYAFNTFPIDEIKPFKDLKEYGDAKPTTRK